MFTNERKLGLKLPFLQDEADVNDTQMLSSQLTENTSHILDKVNWLIKKTGELQLLACETTENLLTECQDLSFEIE